MYFSYFDISEFIIDPNATSIPIHVAEKIVKYHLPILNPIRHQLGLPVYISKNSGYRTVQWEKDRGRSGNSQHTFKGKGAADITSKEKFGSLLELLKKSDYKRITYYPYDKFIHCDFKGDRKKYFEANEENEWIFKGYR